MDQLLDSFHVMEIDKMLFKKKLPTTLSIVMISFACILLKWCLLFTNEFHYLLRPPLTLSFCFSAFVIVFSLSQQISVAICFMELEICAITFYYLFCST